MPTILIDGCNPKLLSPRLYLIMRSSFSLSTLRDEHPYNEKGINDHSPCGKPKEKHISIKGEVDRDQKEHQKEDTPDSYEKKRLLLQHIR